MKRREPGIAIWVGERKYGLAGAIEIPTSGKTGQKWGTQCPASATVELRSTGQPKRLSPHELGRSRLIERKLREKKRMDITWLTERIAVGGGIWSAENMARVAEEGITHIIDMQIEFDDTALAKEHGIEVLWNPTDDDFEPKPPVLFERGVEFAKAALDGDGTKVFIHCAAGVHRAPMMTLAVLASMGWDLEDAKDLIQGRRPVADFAEVYVESVERFLNHAEKT